MIPAAVLAAGASSRMGRPKALLTIDGRTFVRRIVETLRDAGVPRIAVVVRPGSEDVRHEVGSIGGAEVVTNPQPERGQLSSLQAGLEALDRPGVDGLLVTLVDVPLLTSASVATLLEQAHAGRAPIVRAVHRGRHGHPVIFMREVFDALRAADLEAGAKPVMRAYRVADVEVDDPGVAEDVDTPADYDRLAR